MNRATAFGRIRTASAIAGLTVGAVVVATLPSVALTSAAWSDTEWTSGTQGPLPGIGTLECDDNELFSTRGSGAWLSGNLFTIDLATIAELEGEEVTMTNGTQAFTPGSNSLGNNAYANPLNVALLDSALSLQLDDLLTFPPLGVDTGAVNQYGQAKEDGNSAGASGAVSNSGAIDLGPLPGSGLPTAATLQLGTLLDNLLGTGLGGGIANLADVRVNMGAVASSAQLDACAALWDQDVYAHLDRDYEIAGLNAELDSPLVGNLVTAVTNTTTALQNSINTIAGNTRLSLEAAVLGPLSGILSTLGAGAANSTLALTVDFSGVNALLDDVISDPDGIVAIDLASGLITIDLAALFDSVDGLNNQAPNTQLLINDAVVNALTLAVQTALADWVQSVGAALTNAVTNLVTVDFDITVAIAAGQVDITLDGPLGGALVFDAGFSNCNLGIPALCDTVELTVDTLLGLTASVLTGAAGALAGVPALITAATGPIITTLLTVTLPGITGPIVTLLGDVLDGLFGEDRLVSILINAQNAPDPVQAGSPIIDYPEPYWAAGLAGPVASPYESGQFDVSAMRIAVLGAVGAPPVVGIDFARSSVGSNDLN